MGKRKFTEEEEGPPEEKKFRMDRDLSSHEVEIHKTRLSNEGLVCSVVLSSKFGSKSHEQVQLHARVQNQVNIGAKMFRLYPAFKEALLRLLVTIEEVLTDESNRNRLILIHGVPKIGKTSLAYCLSYFLALMAGSEEKVHYLQLSHSAKLNDKVLTDIITDACYDKYLILDQVNTNSLVFSEIMRMARKRLGVLKNRMPLVMFTSGHYTPSERCLSFRNSDLLHYKLIQMSIDTDVISILKKSLDMRVDSVISNDKLLNVTMFYSRMMDGLEYIENSRTKVDEDELRTVLYPGILGEARNDATLSFFWLVWKEYLTKGLPTLEEFTDDDCKMETRHAEYLGYLIGGVKADRGTNAILNQMEIIGNILYEKNGYCEFDTELYFYKYLNKKGLYSVLAGAVNRKAHLSSEKRLEVVLNAFDMLQKAGYSMFNYIKRDLFELAIKYICEKETENEDEPVGMAYLARLDFVSVNESVDVATVDDLCNLPLKYDRCKTSQSAFWCVLNVPGKPPFKGPYDFAYMLTIPERNVPVVKTLQLFQVAVNPEGQSGDKKLIMTDVLDNVKEELERRKLVKRSDADSVVVPYFVRPSGENSQIDVPFRNSSRSIAVEVIVFPQKRLGVK